MQKTFSIKTLGCKANQYESSLIAHQLIKNGWKSFPFGTRVELVIINTCTVTDRSDKKCRNYIRQGARYSHLGKVIVTGCLAERDMAAVAAMKEVYAVFGNKDKPLLYKQLLDLPCFSSQKTDCYISSEENEILPYEHTRAYLRIQDGCDGECTYCIVPSVRGNPASRDSDEVVRHAQTLIEHGCKEIILTGITIGKYQSRDVDLATLIERIIALPGRFRVRVTSIEPKHVTDRLIELFDSDKVCNHIHLPLQSGSDRILRLMKRPYTREEYCTIVSQIRRTHPDIAIGTDIIIGFPGETAQDFADSLAIIEEAGYAYVHQFTFSPRSSTPAATYKGQCAPQETQDRSHEMRSSAAEQSLRYKKKFLNTPLLSLIELKKNGKSTSAISSNYIRMQLEHNFDIHVAGSLVPVTLIRAGEECTGEIVT